MEHKRHKPTADQTHYTTDHRLYTQLGAAKDFERIEQEWNWQEFNMIDKIFHLASVCHKF